MQKPKNAQKTDLSPQARKESKRAFLGYYQDLITQCVAGYYGPNAVARWRTKNGEHEELLNIRSPTGNFFSIDAFAVKNNHVDIHTWMRIPGHDQRYLLVVHGWMVLAAEECRRELFHTFVLDFWDDRFRIVSEVRRLGNSEPLPQPEPVVEPRNFVSAEDLAEPLAPAQVTATMSAPSAKAPLPVSLPPVETTNHCGSQASLGSDASQGSQGKADPAKSSVSSKADPAKNSAPSKADPAKNSWLAIAGSLANAPGELRSSKQLGFATETSAPAKVLSRLWVTPPDVSEEELWELCVEVCPDTLLHGRPEQDFRVEKTDGGRWSSGSGDKFAGDRTRLQRTFLFLPEECANKLVLASRQRKLRTKAQNQVKIDWVLRDGKKGELGKQEGKKGKKGGGKAYDYWDYT
eukprot:GEMP01049962.1.p1 GENE.GEMP01049962.1~~GEMP01049962.1.p1  ORF type:complete len:424 (+),score=77.78 GEMP01049962.1:55-1272(+)